LCCNFADFGVIILFQDVSGWKMGKIVKNLEQAQKRNSYQLGEQDQEIARALHFTG
jgi:hypothetical protein